MIFFKKTLFSFCLIFLVSIFLSAQQNWQPVQMPSDAPVSEIFKIKGFYFCYNHQGVFKSKDSHNWERITPFGNFQLSHEGDTLYALYTTAINVQQTSFIGYSPYLEGLTKQLWKSKDLGITWEKTSLSNSFDGLKYRNFNGDLIVSGGKVFAQSIAQQGFTNFLFVKSCDTCSFKNIYEIRAVFKMFKMQKGDILLLTDISNTYGEQPIARTIDMISKDSLKRHFVTQVSSIYNYFYVVGDSLFAKKDGDYVNRYYSLDTGKTFVKDIALSYLPKINSYYYKMGYNVVRTKDFNTFDTIQYAFVFSPQYPDLDNESTLISSFGDTVFLANHDNLFYSTDNAKTWSSKNKGLSNNLYTPYTLSKRNEFLICNGKYLKYKNSDEWQFPRIKDVDYKLNFPNRGTYYQFIDNYQKTYLKGNSSINKVNNITPQYYWENACDPTQDTMCWFNPQETYLGIFQKKLYTYYLGSIYVYAGNGNRKLMYNYYDSYTPWVLMTDKLFVIYNTKKFHTLTDSKDDAFKIYDIPADFILEPNLANNLYFHKDKIVSVLNSSFGKSAQIRFSADTCKSWVKIHTRPFFSDKLIKSVEIEKDYIWVATTTLDQSRSAVYQSSDLGNSWTRVFEDIYGRETLQVLSFNDSLYVSLSPQRVGQPFLNYWHPNNSNLPVETVYKKSLSLLREVDLIPTTQGLIFHDKNNNGIKEDVEIPLNNFVVKRNEAVTLTNRNGYYDFENFTGQGDTLRVILQNKYMTSKPNFYLTSGIDTARNFAVTIPDVYDYKIDVDKVTEFVPGFKGSLVLCIKNEGTLTESIEVTLSKNDDVYFESALPDYARIDNVRKLIYWQLSDVKPNESRLIKVKFSIPASLPIGAPLQFAGQTKLNFQTDANPTDNIDTLNFKIVGAYDPNDKIVEPKFLTENNIAKGDTIYYIIRFQNTGNYPAAKVVVTDTLGDYFDIGSFKYVSSSHECSIDYKDKGILNFNFNNINLADSISDENGSHGFIKFSIVPKKNLKKGDNILNKASIYFDYNAPIITPTNKLTVGSLTALKEVNLNNYALETYPNPANQILNYEIRDGDFKEGLVHIYDLSGKLMLIKYINQSTGEININPLSKGQFLFSIKGKDNKIYSDYFIKF